MKYRFLFFLKIFIGNKIHFHYRSQQTKLEDEPFLLEKKRKLNILLEAILKPREYISETNTQATESNDIQHSISKDMVFFIGKC